MRLKAIIWLDAVVDKLAGKHGVEVEEVEEVLRNKPRFRYIEKGRRTGEDVYLASGQTDGGRYLIIFFIYKQTREALVISARDATAPERQRYGRR